MREKANKKTRCQNQLFFESDSLEIIFDTSCFKLFLTKIINFCKNNFLKNFQIADESSVRKLRVFYLLLLGENTK